MFSTGGGPVVEEREVGDGKLGQPSPSPAQRLQQMESLLSPDGASESSRYVCQALSTYWIST